MHRLALCLGARAGGPGGSVDINTGGPKYPDTELLGPRFHTHNGPGDLFHHIWVITGTSQILTPAARILALRMQGLGGFRC